MSEYLIILLFFLFVTLMLERKYHVHLYRNRKERLEIILIFFVVGVIWDTFAIWRGHWSFPGERSSGIIIGLMPLEEYLFVLIIPYFIITVYKIVDSKFGRAK